MWGGKGLILRRGSHVYLYCQVGEKLADFLLPNLQRASLAVIEIKRLAKLTSVFSVSSEDCLHCVVRPHGSRIASHRPSGRKERADR